MRTLAAGTLALAWTGLTSVAVASESLPAWQRAGPWAVPTDPCIELEIGQTGDGPLELRFAPEALPTVGRDAKTRGLSLWIAPEPGAPATAVAYRATGPYGRPLSGAGPIRWQFRDGSLCFARGTQPAFCTPATPPLWLYPTAHGAGWQTRVTGCAPLPEASAGAAIALTLAAAAAAAFLVIGPRPRRPLRALVVVAAAGVLCVGAWVPQAVDPRWIAGAALLGLLIAALSLRGRQRAGLGAGAALIVAALALPHPLRGPGIPDTAAESASLAFAADPRMWNPTSPLQALRFRRAALHEWKEAMAPLWIIVGGSVTRGVRVPREAAYPAVAERLLRDRGHPITLLNAGVPAWTVSEADALLVELGDQLPLRGVVVASILNNGAFGVAPSGASACSGRLLAATFCNVNRSPLHLGWLQYFLPKPGNTERFGEALTRLIERERALGRTVLLLDETSRRQIDESARDVRDQAYRAEANAVAARHGLELHAVRQAVSQLPEAARFLDDIHLAPAGHEAVGRRLAEIIEPHLSRPTPDRAGSP